MPLYRLTRTSHLGTRSGLLCHGVRLTAAARRVLVAVLLASLFTATTVTASLSHGAEEEDAEAPMAVVHWLGGMSASRVNYETAVVEMALEKSRDKYGDYTYQTTSEVMTSQRLEREIRDAHKTNIISHPLWAPDEREDPPVLVVPIAISHGLLGYRQCVVRAEDVPRFAEVKSLDDLRQLTAGLGSDWVEQRIFEQNNLNWYGVNTIEQLYMMLARGRFDYLPLGISEVEQPLTDVPEAEKLAVVPDLIIYYPLPVYIQVSASRPELAERITYGLLKARDEGAWAALFDQHYGRVVETLQAQQPRVIVLENPYLPAFADIKEPVLLKPRAQ